jgi:hypothetical protein
MANDTAWRTRLTALGLDPDRDAVNIRILKHTRSLAEYKAWFDCVPVPDAEVNDVRPEKIATIPDGLVRRYVTEHVFQQRIIDNPETIAALEQRVGRFYLFVQAAPDIVITGANPLLINSTGTITIYNTVTIKDGGYIKITVPCKFECQTLTKEQTGGTSPYDVFVVGIDGANDTKGPTPPIPPPAANGQNAECDCCGGAVKHHATPGAPGTDGGSGGDAMGYAKPGQPGPEVYFFIDSALTGTVSFLNQGGTGGAGATGGYGAQGGQGGKGGNGTTCGAFYPDGANGGPGGKGGNGGNGSDGRDGGAGGTLTIRVPEAQRTNILVTNGNAPGGAKGSRGLKGVGGQGGAGGSHGGSAGPDGKPGDTDGLDGRPGAPGTKGKTTINGVPAGN